MSGRPMKSLMASGNRLVVGEVPQVLVDLNDPIEGLQSAVPMTRCAPGSGDAQLRAPGFPGLQVQRQGGARGPLWSLAPSMVKGYACQW